MVKMVKQLMLLLIVLSFVGCVKPPADAGDVKNNTQSKAGKSRKSGKRLHKGKMRKRGLKDRKRRGLNRKKGKDNRFKVSVTDQHPYMGAKDALVTIVEFSDYQCPFCSRVEPTLHRLMKEYDGKIKLVWKDNPLGFHKQAMPAALAAYTIFKLKGNDAFWKAHDIFYKNSRKLNMELFEKTASDLGVDMAKFKEAMKKKTYERFIRSQQAEGARLGARGTPGFFINGKFLSGAQPYPNFKRVLVAEMKIAEALAAKGVSVDKIYAEITKNGLTKAPKRERKNPRKKKQRPGQPDPKATYKVTVGSSPVVGPNDALVTIVEFSEVQCPFCKRVEPTLKKVMDAYPGKVRIVWKNNPLPFHKMAGPGAEALAAAHAQGKFSEMQHKLFQNPRALTPEIIVGYAKEIGLDMGKFEKEFKGGAYKTSILRDQAQARQFGARGTPAFFINGRFLSGARPFAHFKTLIDEEMKKAEALVASGVAKKDVYAKTIAKGETKIKAAPQRPQRQRPGQPDPKKAYFQDIKGLPYLGTKDALVTIVEFSEFQCPFCSRAEPTLHQILKEYDGKVKLVWKHNPLGFHKMAMPAAMASHAIYMLKGNDAFWKAHDIFYKNSRKMNMDLFEKTASDLGVDMAKFKEAMAKKTYESVIRKQQVEGSRVGARGTPAFFINGRFLSGARPFSHFKPVIDQEIKKAEAMIAKGTPKAMVYTEIMKKAERKLAAGAAKNNRRRPPEDNKVYDIPASPKSPSWGPANAKVRIVEFSEFQCPFCNRVMPSLKKIKEQYAGKVRIEFRHLPLPFHKNAMGAAKAVIAANNQGKFWEMHDIMFSNHRKLSADDLVGYASKLGLDLKKFEADIADPATEAMIKADMAIARKVGARGTPTFFINGKKLVGAQPFAKFKEKIDAALKAAK